MRFSVYGCEYQNIRVCGIVRRRPAFLEVSIRVETLKGLTDSTTRLIAREPYVRISFLMSALTNSNAVPPGDHSSTFSECLS